VPELPDVALYVEHLTRRLEGRTLEKVRVASPFFLRTVTPPLALDEGRTIRGFRRLGKRIVFELEGGPFIAVHLMIAGRFHWKDAVRAPVPKKIGLAAFAAALRSETGDRFPEKVTAARREA
jgi:formamidopyrimidine-DNA glycosylase